MWQNNKFFKSKGDRLVDKYLITTIQNAITILRLFTKEQPEWNLSDISRAINLSTSSTNRLLTTLAEHGYLQKNKKTKRYSLGFSILTLSGIIKTTMIIHREAKPVMENLVQQLGYSVHLGVLEGTDIVYLEKLESPHPVRLNSHIGKKNPAYCTGCGKIILAFQQKDAFKSTLAQIETIGYQSFGKNTVKNSDELLVHLDKIRRQGYSVCVNEFHQGVSIGAPIYDYSGQVVAAVSVTGWESQIHVQDIPFLTGHVVEASKKISNRLGHYF